MGEAPLLCLSGGRAAAFRYLLVVKSWSTEPVVYVQIVGLSVLELLRHQASTRPQTNHAHFRLNANNCEYA